MSTIGDRILARRQDLALTQETLAQKLNYKTKSSINKIEAGINKVPVQKLEAFAEALDTTVAYLLGFIDDPERHEDDDHSELSGTEMYLIHQQEEDLKAKGVVQVIDMGEQSPTQPVLPIEQQAKSPQEFKEDRPLVQLYLASLSLDNKPDGYVQKLPENWDKILDAPEAEDDI